MNIYSAIVTIAISACALTPQAVRAENSDICAGDGIFAKLIMQTRQHRLHDINVMMKKFGEEPGLRAMIIDAYGQPAMQTATTRQVMIDEFINKWSLKCYEDGPVLSRKAEQTN
ncbi:hypothetical protein MALG_02499 [Marinovum algicola DG 898]|nr:hypothetical protein MALG_02499 [Marinovum algicola DG 898]